MEILSSQTVFLAIVCVLNLLLFPCSAKVVVFFSVPSVSHIRYHTDMARAVTKLGHESWVCIPDYLKGSNRIDTTGIKALDYGESLGNLEQKLVEERRIQENFWEGESFNPYDYFQLLLFMLRALDNTLKEGLYEKVEALKPDLFVVDGIPLMRSMLVIPYKLGIQYAFAGTLHDVVNARVPFSPVATPSLVLSYSDQMTFFERLHSAVTYFIEFLAFRLAESDIVAKYAPEMPYLSLSDLAAGAAIYLAETDPILDYPRPMLPNTKLIGGTSVKVAKPLKEPYKTFVEKSDSGIAIVTFGSSILNVPDTIFRKIVNAFSQLELSFVMRVNATSPDKNRVLTDTWIPQNDLLGHQKTKLFVSHCGKNGQYEALYHAVPILCLPVFADQNYNAERVKVKGYGARADIRTVSTDDLTGILRELLTNSKYQSNIAKASSLFRLLYKSPMEEAAFWLDHVMVYGGDYMRASSQKIPLYQFLMLDVIAFMILMSVFSISVLCFCMSCCYKACYRARPPKTKNE